VPRKLISWIGCVAEKSVSLSSRSTSVRERSVASTFVLRPKIVIRRSLLENSFDAVICCLAWRRKSCWRAARTMSVSSWRKRTYWSALVPHRRW
jgi:hypothetical protein